MFNHTIAIIWKLLELTLQGVVGGLIVIFVGEWIQSIRRKNRLKKLADALTIELETHLAFWEKLLSGKTISDVEMTVLKDYSYWSFNLDTIFTMKKESLRYVTFYFRSAFQTIDQLKVKTFQKRQIETLYLSAQQAMCCLGLYVSTKRKDRATFAEELARLAHLLRDLDNHRTPTQ